MISSSRDDCSLAIKKFSKEINLSNPKNILYVGIAGDPIGGEYSNLFQVKPVTFDFDKKWGPDIVGDITKTNFENNTWDCIIVVQVVEHIPNIFDLPNELYRILKPSGHIIIDSPWMYPYHPEPPSFGDFWRISRDGFRYLFSKFLEIDSFCTSNNNSFLFRKLT